MAAFWGFQGIDTPLFYTPPHYLAFLSSHQWGICNFLSISYQNPQMHLSSQEYRKGSVLTAQLANVSDWMPSFFLLKNLESSLPKQTISFSSLVMSSISWFLYISLHYWTLCYCTICITSFTSHNTQHQNLNLGVPYFKTPGT